MKKLYSLLVAAAFMVTASAQTLPPAKIRSNDSFTQVDNFLSIAKNLRIPTSASDDRVALTSVDNQANLLFNTTLMKLRVYVNGTWRDASTTDLSNYYTKAEVNALIAAIPTPDMSKYMRNDTTNIVSASDWRIVAENNEDIGFSVYEEGDSGPIGFMAKSLNDGSYSALSPGGIAYGSNEHTGRLDRYGLSGSTNGREYRFGLGGIWMGTGNRIYPYPSGDGKSSYLKMPITSNNPTGIERVIATNVNGNYADETGRITIPQPDMSNYYDKTASDSTFASLKKTNVFTGTNMFEGTIPVTYRGGLYAFGNSSIGENSLQVTPSSVNVNSVLYLNETAVAYPNQAVPKKYLDEKVDLKQDKLVSGTNIKTVGGQSILGSGNIDAAKKTEVPFEIFNGGIRDKRSNISAYTSGITIGNMAGNDATGSDGSSSIFIGNYAGRSSSNNGSGSMFIGVGSGRTSTNSSKAIFIGSLAGELSTGAVSTIAIGGQAGRSSSMSNGVIIGEGTGVGVNGDYSTIIGSGSGNGSKLVNSSVIIGHLAGRTTDTISNTIIIGSSTASNLGKSKNSIIIGNKTGSKVSTNTIGDNNILIGTNITLPANSENKLNIGGAIFGEGMRSNDTSTPSYFAEPGAKIGIGTASIPSTLSVGGGDIEVIDNTKGLILRDGTGGRWRITVTSSGQFQLNKIL